MAHILRRCPLDEELLERWVRPRDGLVAERLSARTPSDGHTAATWTFEAVHGPVRRYRRTVTVEGDRLTVATDYALGIPYFGWLVALPFRRTLARPPAPEGEGGRQPWWAPPDRLDHRGAAVLATLAAATLMSGYLGTLITQTITYVADDFGLDTTHRQSLVLAFLRTGIVIALVLTTMADRVGRRRVLIWTAAAGSLAGGFGALAPQLEWLIGAQLISRAMATALAVIIGVVAAEEMPKGSRAYAASLLAMSAALGAGLCVMLLPLADLGTGGWRLIHGLVILGLPLSFSISRHLPESRRFVAPHREVSLSGHGRRLILLAVSGVLLLSFATPASQFQNEFLRDERGMSAAAISLFTLLTVTPAGIGLVIGGHLADTRGRRRIGAVGVVGGTLLTLGIYFAEGWAMWAWSLVAGIVGALAIPVLAVYGPELFPTSLRGRANGIITLFNVIGSVLGLLIGGVLADHLGLSRGLAVLAVGPLILGVLFVTLYPETARLDLDELNPEDLPALPPAHQG